jgi:predicted PurR-regulated permease PerM
MRLKISIWRVLGILALVALGIVFFKIVIYLVISLVLFLVGYPLTNLMKKIKIGRFNLPQSLAALITIFLMLFLFVSLFLIIVPPLANEINFLSKLNFYDVLHNTIEQFPKLKLYLLKLGTEEQLKRNASLELNSMINNINYRVALGSAFNMLGTFIGGLLCVMFITFFFLKDQQLAKSIIINLTPTSMEKEVHDILRTSKKMLSQYFAGLFTDMFIVGLLVFISLSIIGIKNALIISFVAGILNVIPYIGSVITMLLAVFIGVSGCISGLNYQLIGPTISKIFITILSINLIDGFIIQPIIFSNSVKAHPLEIFIVTLMAGVLGGVVAMVVALPVYTLIRIVAKEFLTQIKFIKKLTENIPE